ncbi:Aminopeptidase O [Collichthys lucidus]|uniref:Aminopeptidase O n=1 Tax=Collichthys lucidus TaxID=240159 RepID=A0A4U5UTN6_COLLU|nr:Aminopeptidase O [Collichthys lucidus]
MEPDGDLNPNADDLPLATTNHILVRHYVLDLTVHFDRKVISGSVVLFLEPCSGVGTKDTGAVLDCCDLDVSKVEEVDVTSVSAMSDLLPEDGNSLHFYRDRWSLQVRKKGVTSPLEFPRALRICYETRPTGASVKWTKDQDNRVCVYTAGSPINNRALFPCQEPPVAMSTWQATVRGPSFLIWNYYVTMPMPASTFTLAVGHWRQVTVENPLAVEEWAWDKKDCGKTAKREAEPGEWTEAELVSGFGSSTSKVVKGSPLQTGSGDRTTCSDSALCYSSLEDEGLSVTDYSGMEDDGISCSHGDYPCRFTERSARSQRVIPHRVFGPVCLLQKAQMVLKLMRRCLAAAHTILGVHPFPRLDILIVPAGFSSLGMASPHIIFLSQSVLYTESPGSGESGLSLCGSRLCHEIAHSWFGLVIGARDWTEEWISEGFATYLEDIIWAQAQQVQPNMENTGQVSESGSSTVKHALNPDKAFMQVHYLKGYFLLRFLASQVGEQQFIDFFRLFVKKYHGQLILSQVVKWILLSQRHQGKGRKRKRIEPKVKYKEVGGTLLY